jgi:hypothetical protein
MPSSSYTQDLTSGAMSQEFTFFDVVRLNQILINFSTNITETITITLKSTFGTNYDVILDKVTLNSDGDYAFIPDRRPFLNKGDTLLIQCTNANTTGILYGTYQVENRGS